MARPRQARGGMLATVRSSRRRRCTLAPISAIFTYVTIATAEPPPEAPRVAVRITARTSEFAAEFTRDNDVVARCSTPCALELATGKYSIRLTDPIGNETVERAKLVGSSHLTITSPDQTAKWTGLALGIGGTGSALVGVGLLFALTQKIASQPSSPSRSERARLLRCASSASASSCRGAPVWWCRGRSTSNRPLEET
jgi:hypothetical protein